MTALVLTLLLAAAMWGWGRECAARAAGPHHAAARRTAFAARGFLLRLWGALVAALALLTAAIAPLAGWA